MGSTGSGRGKEKCVLNGLVELDPVNKIIGGHNTKKNTVP